MNMFLKGNKNKYVFWSIALGIFLITWYLTSKTQLYADDYNYKFIWGTNNRVSSLKDVLESQYYHYFQWGGRTVAHTLVQIFLLLNKNIFNFFNALIFTLLNILIYLNALGKSIKNNYNATNLIIIYLLLWNCIPVFGECVFWLTGSINYLWTIVIILIFILPFRLLYNGKNSIKNNKRNIAFFTILGVLAGWTNENTAIALIILILVMLIFLKKNNMYIPKWAYGGFLGSLVGFILMVSAPGNFARASNIKLNIIQKFLNFIESLQRNIQQFGLLFLFLLIILIGIITLNQYSKTKVTKVKYEYFFSSLLIFISFISVGAMIASPYFPERALFGVSIFMIISVMIFLFSVEDYSVRVYSEYFKIIIISILTVLFIMSLGKAIIKINKLEKKINNRNIEIETQINNGITNITIEPIDMIKDNHVFLIELSNDEKDWKNRSFSKYFKINSIKINESN